MIANSPDKVWLYGGYISRDLVEVVKGVLSREMSDETALSICVYMDFCDSRKLSLTPYIASAKLDYRLESVVNYFLNNRGFSDKYDAVFALNMLGYENYKLLSDAVKGGGEATLEKACDKCGRMTYTIKSDLRELDEPLDR